MTPIETIEQQVSKLSQREFAAFRDWFFAFESDAWDRQIERDAKAGKLDVLARKALEDHAVGRIRRL